MAERSLWSRLRPNCPFFNAKASRRAKKQRIGQAAAALVQDGETVFLSSGTTVLEAARALRGRQNLTVIYEFSAVVNALAGAEGIAVICLGGMLRNSELSFIGHITELALAELRADKI